LLELISKTKRTTERPANPPRGLGGHQKQKIFFTFSDLARGKNSLKWKRKFCFWCSALQVFGQVAGLQFGLRQSGKSIFWG
jgi:hypothetical protein